MSMESIIIDRNVCYRYADGNIVVGFSAGYFISISTKPREIGEELYQTKNHHGKLTFLCISSPLSKMATCGDNS